MPFFSRSKSPDLIYIEGSGDIVEALKRWYEKEDLISETSLTFSSQVFDFCKKNNISILAISSYPKPKSIKYNDFSAFSKKKLGLSGSLGYYISQISYGLYVNWLAIKHKPKYIHITTGNTFFILLAPIKLLGIKVFPQFHNTLWAKGYPPQRVSQRFFLSLDAFFLKYIASAAFCCSPEIKNQIIEVTQAKNCPTHVFKAQFQRQNFQNTPPPPENRVPFVIAFAGRIEKNKGVYDILHLYYNEIRF